MFFPLEEDRSEIAFFDVETTVPTRPGQGFAILEFGAILVCPKKLVELRNYSTLIRPKDLSHITSLSVRCNGINRDDVVSAATFEDIADIVYDLLNGRIWAGHNILRFDCPRIREAFAEINRPAPVPKGTIDSLHILTQKFGRRAGDMKMATLATYFGLGQQTHRSLDDVRMNLEVLKYCATVLFLESSLPDIFTENSWISPNATTRSRSNTKRSANQNSQIGSPPSSSTQSPQNHIIDNNNHPILSLMTPNTCEINFPITTSNASRTDPFNMTALLEASATEEEKTTLTPQESSPSVNSKIPNEITDFFDPDEISISSIGANLVPFYRGSQKIQLVYNDLPLLLSCRGLRIRFGISTKFFDHLGRPRLSFVADALPSLCNVLDASDRVVQQKVCVENESGSEWRPVVSRKAGFFNSPTIRLHLPTVSDGGINRWATEIYQKDMTATQRLVFSRFDVNELESLFTPGNLVDAYFSLDPYDYQQNAGIRLVARKLILH